MQRWNWASLYVLLSHHTVHFNTQLTKWIRHHQGSHGNNKYCSFTLCHIIKDASEWDLTLHRSTHHVTKEPAPPLCIILNYHLNVWVGEIFQHYTLCSHLRIFNPAEKAMKHLHFCTLFTSPPIPSVCPSDFAPSLSLSFFLSSFHPLNPAAVEWCGSQCFIYHCVPREDMFHPPGRVAVPDRSQSVCWLNNGARDGRKREEERGRAAETERILPLPLSPAQPPMYKKKLLATNWVLLNWGEKSTWKTNTLLVSSKVYFNLLPTHIILFNICCIWFLNICITRNRIHSMRPVLTTEMTVWLSTQPQTGKCGRIGATLLWHRHTPHFKGEMGLPGCPPGLLLHFLFSHYICLVSDSSTGGFELSSEMQSLRYV